MSGNLLLATALLPTHDQDDLHLHASKVSLEFRQVDHRLCPALLLPCPLELAPCALPLLQEFAPRVLCRSHLCQLLRGHGLCEQANGGFSCKTPSNTQLSKLVLDGEVSQDARIPTSARAWSRTSRSALSSNTRTLLILP